MASNNFTSGIDPKEMKTEYGREIYTLMSLRSIHNSKDNEAA